MKILRDTVIEHTHRVKVNNGELLYTTIGKGEPVLCIHGVNIAEAIISPFQWVPEIFEKYQFISYYRAGYHGSRLEKDSITIEESAEHAKQLLDHLEIKKTHLIGYSFGGIIAFQFLLSYPELIHSAILLEPYLPRESPAAVQANIQAYNKALKIYQEGEKLAAAQSYQQDICGLDFFSSVDVTCSLDVWDKVAEVSDTVFNIDLPAYSKWSFKISQADRWMAQKPTMPILAVMGMNSESACPGFRETQQFLMSWLPQAERYGVMGTTHGLQMMNPWDVTRACLSFLEKNPMKANNEIIKEVNYV